ncbi:alpha-amylase domain-containing protein [Mucilaginibacter sp.]
MRNHLSEQRAYRKTLAAISLSGRRFCWIVLITLLAACAKDKPLATDPALTGSASALAVASIQPLASGGIAGKEVLMQAFYWDVPMGGTWWQTIQSKVSSWNTAGVTAIWLPPASKGASGGYSMGYDPFDYFDFGDYNQMGTTETRFGSKAELLACISAAHNSGLKVYADIVMNHNYGGSAQNNPNTGGATNTSFIPASNIFPRGYNDFHPSSYEQKDSGTWSNYPDLCLANPYVQGGLWSNTNSVAKYYKNTLGFDGWRFDWIDGYNPAYVKNFVTAAPGFAVTEYWGPSGGTNVTELQSAITASGASSFDFPCLQAMKNAFTNNNLNLLSTTSMLCKTNPAKAVTFVTNHDVNYIPDNRKLQAYAFIMAHEGTPCLFYPDYESLLDKGKMNTLIWINKNLAAGNTSVLYADNDEYVAKMNGAPGLIIYINTSSSTLTRSVSTDWKSSTLHDFANNWSSDVTTNASGTTTLSVPANSYTIWSATGATGGGTTGNVNITLRMQKDVFSGNSLYFSGNQAALTNWGSGLEGAWNSGNYWTKTATVPAGVALEFKSRKGVTGSGGDVWETGANHVISNPVNGTTYTFTFNGGF